MMKIIKYPPKFDLLNRGDYYKKRFSKKSLIKFILKKSKIRNEGNPNGVRGVPREGINGRN